MSVIVSAPGKIHLLGEHAVVYGKPALLVAIDKRLYVRIKNLELRIKNKNKEEIKIESSEGKNLILHSIAIFKKAFSTEELPSLEISITSQIPTGSGLGSSAALSASVIGSLMKYIKKIWNPNKINELAFEVEKIAHGNPSGADNTTVVFGGLVWYRLEFDFLKSIWSLPISSYKIPQFYMIDTGRPIESTYEMVAGVASLYKKKKKQMDELFNDQEVQTKRLLLSLKNGDSREFKESIIKGEENLEKMGIVGRFARNIIKEIEEAGGVAKVCGAGGRKERSGILLVFHDELSVLKRIADRYNLPAYPVKLGGEGIRIEKII